MTQLLSSESDNLAACYLFILERMRVRRQKQEENRLATLPTEQSGPMATPSANGKVVEINQEYNQQ